MKYKDNAMYDLSLLLQYSTPIDFNIRKINNRYQ